jgi:hypothetical protein
MHAECNFHTHCGFDTHKCDHDTDEECVFNTHKIDFYTQSVLLTQMSVIMTITSVITARTNVIKTRRSEISTRTGLFLHAEYDFHTQSVCEFHTNECDYDTHDTYLSKTDIFRGFSFNKVLIFQEFGKN